MHQKIQEVLENILQDKNETDKFLKMESADEIYDYFLEKIPDLSEEEFEDFMIDTLETYIHEQGKIEKLSPDSLNNVSGGVSLPKRFAAGIAGVLTLIPSASGLQTSKNMSEEAPSYLSMAKDKVEHVKFQVSNKFRKLKQLIKENPIISSIVAAAILAVTIMTVVLVRKHKKSKIQSQVGTGSMFQTPIQGATENSGSATHTPTHGENLDRAQQTTTPPGQPNRSASPSAPTAPGSSAQQTTSTPEQPNALPRPILRVSPVNSNGNPAEGPDTTNTTGQQNGSASPSAPTTPLRVSSSRQPHHHPPTPMRQNPQPRPGLHPFSETTPPAPSSSVPPEQPNESTFQNAPTSLSPRLPHFNRSGGPGRRPPTQKTSGVASHNTAPGTPPRVPSSRQPHQDTPRPTGGKTKSRLILGSKATAASTVSSAPNPRPTSDGASVRVQPTTPLTNPATPPELPPKPSSLNPNTSSISTSRSSRNSGRRSHRRQNATLTASSSGAHDGTSPSENPLPPRPDQVGTADANNAPKNFLSIKERMTQLDTAKAASQPQPKPTGGIHKRGVSPVIRRIQDDVGQKATIGMQQFTQQAANPGKPPPSAKSLMPNSATQGAPVSTIPPQRPPRPRRPDKLPEGYDQAVELYEKYLYDPAFRDRDPKSNDTFNQLSNRLLRTIPANGKIPGATPENGAAEVFGFLRTGKNALNNAFTQLRNSDVPKCMQIKGHKAGEPNNDKYATPPR